MTTDEQILFSLGSLHSKVDGLIAKTAETDTELKSVGTRVTALEHDKTAVRTLIGVGGAVAGAVGGFLSKWFHST